MYIMQPHWRKKLKYEPERAWTSDVFESGYKVVLPK